MGESNGTSAHSPRYRLPSSISMSFVRSSLFSSACHSTGLALMEADPEAAYQLALITGGFVA